jgi:lysostaphin
MIRVEASATSTENDLSVSVSNRNPKQGQTFEVVIEKTIPDGEASSQEISPAPEISFNHKTYKSFPAATIDQSNNAGTTGSAPNKIQYRALIAIPVDLSAGNYLLRLGEQQESIKVRPGTFVMQRLALSKKTVALKPSPGELEAVDQAKQALSSDRQWADHFVVPCRARVSTTFGAQRIVNGKRLQDYFHSGIDYAGNLGAPIYATAPGKVILAAKGYALHGNVVCIDHGQGVVSFYLHMQKMLVKVGQVVKAGQQIGNVGQSGRANGPHLHFSLYVNQVATDPNSWYQKAF